MRMLLLCLSLLASASPLAAQEALGLAAPPALADTGLLQYLLPRFSLKTGVRVVPDPGGTMELADAAPGTPVFAGAGVTWHLRPGDDPRAVRFLEWLTSDIGRRTIDSFPGPATFTTDLTPPEEDTAPEITGDAALGADLSRTHCARCHVIGEADRNKGIGSTPSFAVLRALNDWDERFMTFYVRAPHPAFTQIQGITAPFDITRPSPIAPLLMQPEDIDAILAFVAAMNAANLGAPLQLQ
ncbi:MAG: c-type cytochrome [Pseudooceanicola sp.]|nr:c-type cytochrome [Pseudooceanicola sp.]